MALIVVGSAGLFFRPAAAQTEPPAAPAPEEPVGSGPFGLNLESWTGRDLLEQVEQNRLAVLAAATLLVAFFLWAADVFKPGGLAKGGRDVKSHPAPVWAIAGLMVMSAAVFSGAILATQRWLVGPDPGSLKGSALLMGGVYAVSGAVAGALVYLFARSAPKAGLVPRVMDLPIGLLCLVLAAPVVMLAGDLGVMVYERITGSGAQPVAHEELSRIVANRGDPWVWGLVAAVVVGAPVVEEATYRVFLQSALLKWVGSPWAAVAGSAAIFTSMHAIGPTPVPPYALATIAALALSMGIAFERTRRIGVPIVMHMGFNAANILIALQTQAV